MRMGQSYISHLAQGQTCPLSGWQPAVVAVGYNRPGTFWLAFSFLTCSIFLKKKKKKKKNRPPVEWKAQGPQKKGETPYIFKKRPPPPGGGKPPPFFFSPLFM
eukprot:FR737661.1.p2 GENE.FR737661.1~~FR737661.1.p2  ORF type:complete len:103 (+),score=63.40 FR737661.1:851-1159(+)